MSVCMHGARGIALETHLITDNAVTSDGRKAMALLISRTCYLQPV